jgi:hypothetical protein
MKGLAGARANASIWPLLALDCGRGAAKLAQETQTGGRDNEGGDSGDRTQELLDAIDRGIERAVGRLLDPQREVTVTDIMKLRDVVKDVLKERPHEVVVRWVDPCGKDESPSG